MCLQSQKLVLLSGIVLLAVCSAAPGPTRPKTIGKAKSVAITGCLQKGNTLDRFVVRGSDGKVYALRSTAVKLSEHLGQNVTIHGELKHDQKRDDYEFEGSEANEEYGKGKVIDPVDVEVQSLAVVGTSCR
jgi:maltose-binding protein MalE